MTLMQSNAIVSLARVSQGTLSETLTAIIKDHQYIY